MTDAAKAYRIGVVPLARATFDVALAEEVAAGALATLEALPGVDLVGPRDLLFDAEATLTAIDALEGEQLDLLVVLQVTFTDASMTVALGHAIDAPLLLWAFPEPRTGGRLRLNSFCGINLAGHALGKAGRAYGYLYGRPNTLPDPDTLIAQAKAAPPNRARPPGSVADARRADKALATLRGKRLAVFGRHPDGFETCAYDPARLADLTGIETEALALEGVFERARGMDEQAVAAARARVGHELAGLDRVEAEPLEKTLRVYGALSALSRERGYAGMAVRCWPEFFTDYGCAACGAMAMMTEDGVPASCEADVYGTATNLLLQEIAGEPVFIADLVDLDAETDTGVLWHCGLAPISMADPADTPEATVHSNRRKPLLGAFALKPGRITIARLSQARGVPKLVVGGGEMISAPRSFSGTSGVVRFDRPVGDVLATVMGEGLEHHYAIAYGDYRATLDAVAARLGLEVLDLA